MLNSSETKMVPSFDEDFSDSIKCEKFLQGIYTSSLEGPFLYLIPEASLYITEESLN